MMRLGLLMCAVFLCTQIDSIQGQCATANGTECTRDDLDDHLLLTPLDACYDNGTTATAVCVGQFEVELACENGTWNSTPICNEYCTIVPIPDSNNEENRNLTHTESFTIECNDGYSFEQTTEFPVTCIDGTLNGTVPTICLAQCTIPAVPNSNNDAKSNLTHGSNFTIQCDDGFSFGESTQLTVTCSNGDLDKNVPTECSDLRLGDQISLNCTSGFYEVAIPLLLFDNDTAGLESVNMGGCQGTRKDNDFVYIKSLYTDCGTTVEEDSGRQLIVYENQVVNADNGGNVITTDSAIIIDITCTFDQNELVSSLAVMQNVLMQQRDGKSEFNLIFNVFTDAGYANNIAGVYIETNSDIFIKAQVVDVLELDVYPTSCYATPVESANMTLFYQLITNGTSDDPEFAKNLRDADIDGKPSFSFESKAFRFSNSSSREIYIHCWLKICPDNGCLLPDSVARRRRSIRDTPLTVTKYVKAGPIKVREPRAAEDATGTTGSSWQMTAMMVYSATLSLIAVCAIGIMGVIVYRRRPTTDGYGRL